MNILGRLRRTYRLLIHGVCNAFDDDGHPAEVKVDGMMRVRIAYVWWFW